MDARHDTDRDYLRAWAIYGPNNNYDIPSDCHQGYGGQRFRERYRDATAPCGTPSAAHNVHQDHFACACYPGSPDYWFDLFASVLRP